MSDKPKKRRHVGSYTLGTTIGQGAFGKVKLGTDIFNGEKVAVKIIRYKNVKTEKEKKQIEREQNILLRLHHPNIVNLKKVVNDEKRGRSYMIFEYAPQGELFDYIVSHGRLSERDARKFMRQIVSALEYCHALLIIHRDLKPENVLLDAGYNIKISDFGLSNIMVPGKRFNTFCGSLHYACPEILRGEEYVGPGVDIWSVGIILYCLVVGRQPWDADNAEGLIRAILEEGLEVPSGLSDDCVDLLLQMLRVSEYDRIPIAKIRTHPWILEGHGEPPPSYLPPAEPIKEIDEAILDDLYMLSFLESNDPEYLETIREELLSNKKTQLVVVYNLLLQQKREKKKGHENELQPPQEKHHKKDGKAKSEQTLEMPRKSISLSSSVGNSPVVKKQKGIKPIVITAKGEATPEKHKKKTTPNPKKILSPIDKVTSSTRQRSTSLSNKNENTSNKTEQEQELYSDEEDDDENDDDDDFEEEKALDLIQPPTEENDGNESELLDVNLLKPEMKNPAALALQNRHRSASLSPHAPRPVLSFDDVISGKIGTPTKSTKKRAQTPQKTKRPSVLSENMFKPPEQEKVPDVPKLNNLSEIQGTMDLLPSPTSTKPLEQIVEEVVRVLNKEEIRYQKRKNKYIWKCSAEVGHEAVQLELEIVHVKNSMCGIMVRRIQGSFPHYQELYQMIKKELKL